MKRNSIYSDNGRVRYVGRDFDLYFFLDEDGAKLATLTELAQAAKTKSQELDVFLKDYSGYKMVASTNCTFNSTATYETIVDKSTPKSGKKQLQSVDWNFSSDNNIADIEDVKKLVEAHKLGLNLYVQLRRHFDQGETPDVDADGSINTQSDDGKFVEGWCVVQSITLNAQDGSLATFSMTLEGSGDFDV